MNPERAARPKHPGPSGQNACFTKDNGPCHKLVTTHDHAPWIVIPANYKWYARVQVVKSAAERVAKVLDL